MINKTYRPGAYGLIFFEGKGIFIKKSRGPFTGMYDLPGGKIDHGEDHNITIKREIKEELGINEISSVKLLNVFYYISNHKWNNEDYSEHMIGIVYICNVKQLPNMSCVDMNTEVNDSSDYILLDLKDYRNFEFSPICKNAIEYYLKTIA